MATFVLVHGGGHSSWHWNLVCPLLEARGHHVLTPDVPMDDPGAGVVAWADTVLDVLAANGNPDDVVLVGHSLAGLAIPQVAARYPLRHLIFLCANVPEVGRSYESYLRDHPDAVIMPAVVPREDGRVELDYATARDIYYSDCDEELARAAYEHLVPTALQAFTEMCPLDAWPDVRTSYIMCTEDKVIGPDWSRWASREQLTSPAVEIPGGHSPMLARPELLVDTLIAVVEGAITSTAGSQR